ncbi:hypothetical protein NIES4073_70080 [Kalymmatonema gypsitolerans NIES-4073]|nr:hypothetical protein NIES4073_70080 [Scytonema sp. NIES-4073]
MPRQPRELKAGYCYHITVRCNNREFRLTRFECREVLLYAVKRCQNKYSFKLYALCIMSNAPLGKSKVKSQKSKISILK